ncbi:hypothetical protein Tco_0356525 [Tanacetum coccineum]
MNEVSPKRQYSNTSNSIDEQPNKRRCKTEKFEAIQYSLGPNEEYIALRKNGQRLKKYHDGHINEEEKEVVELDDDTTDPEKEISDEVGGMHIFWNSVYLFSLVSNAFPAIQFLLH